MQKSRSTTTGYVPDSKTAHQYCINLETVTCRSHLTTGLAPDESLKLAFSLMYNRNSLEQPYFPKLEMYKQQSMCICNRKMARLIGVNDTHYDYNRVILM